MSVKSGRLLTPYDNQEMSGYPLPQYDGGAYGQGHGGMSLSIHHSYYLMCRQR
jgi:hypothetical protein